MMKCKKQFLAAAVALGAILSATAQDLKPVAPETAKTPPVPVVNTPAPAEELIPASEFMPEPKKATEAKAPEAKAPEVKAPEVKAPEAKAEKLPEAKVSPDPTVALVDQSIQAEEKAAEETKHVVYKRSKLIPYVLLTANYEIPRIFAETARKQLDVPYIILLDSSKTPTVDAEAVFFPPNVQEPIRIKAKDISKLLAYLRARDVIILGNTDYVPAFYQKAVPAVSRKLIVNSADWRLNAIKLSNILNTDKITKTFAQYRERRAAELEQKRADYEKAQQVKAEAIKNANKSEQALIDAAAH